MTKDRLPPISSIQHGIRSFREFDLNFATIVPLGPSPQNRQNSPEMMLMAQLEHSGIKRERNDVVIWF